MCISSLPTRKRQFNRVTVDGEFALALIERVAGVIEELRTNHRERSSTVCVL